MKKLRKILILCTNFNSYDHLVKYYNSIEFAYKNSVYEFKLNFIIGDNSLEFQEFIPNTTSEIVLHHVNNGNNLGYIGGIEKRY